MVDMEDTRARSTVLIVEDERPIANLFKTLLRVEGFSAHTVSNNADALAYLEEQVPDAVILDVMMPGESGLDICRYVRGMPKLKHLPVIVVSALTQSDDVNEGIEAGADAYLQKPISNDVLVDTIRRQIGLNSSKPPPRSPVVSLELEVEKAVVEVSRYIAEIDRAERAYEHFVEYQEKRRDLSLQDKQAKCRQAAESYRRQIRLTQEAGWEVFESILKKLELREFAIRRRGSHQPNSAEEWQIASARAQFVREECRAWADSNPQQIILEYQAALAADEKIYAYLLERYGQESLEARNDWENLSRLRSRIADVNHPAPDKLSRVQGLYDQMNPLRAKLASIRPPDALILVEGLQDIGGTRPAARHGNGVPRGRRSPVGEVPPAQAGRDGMVEVRVKNGGP